MIEDRGEINSMFFFFYSDLIMWCMNNKLFNYMFMIANLKKISFVCSWIVFWSKVFFKLILICCSDCLFLFLFLNVKVVPERYCWAIVRYLPKRIGALLRTECLCLRMAMWKFSRRCFPRRFYISQQLGKRVSRLLTSEASNQSRKLMPGAEYHVPGSPFINI